MKKIISKLTLLILTLCFIAPSVAHARGDRVVSYREVFEALDSKQLYLPRHFSIAGPNVILNKVLRSELMTLPGNDYSFDELANFIKENPNWPKLNGIIMIAEQKLPIYYKATQIVDWYRLSPPKTFNGLLRYVDALKATKQTQQAVDHVRDWWVNRNFSSSERKVFYKRFKNNFRAVDHKNRISRLIWDGKIKDARAMYRFLDKPTKALMMARVSLYKNQSKANKYIRAVPKELLSDDGLIYDRLRWRRKRGLNSGAMEILDALPEGISHGGKWWDERHIVIRRLMERRKYKYAYHLASRNGLRPSDGFDYLQAEFLSGFLALRKINQPQNALTHFTNLAGAAQTPVSRARGHYWLARAYAALGEKRAAKDSYETAGSLNTTYYGQLALSKINNQPVIYARPESTVPRSVKNKFNKHDMTQAILQLDRIGQERRAERFYFASLKASHRRADFAMLLDLAYKKNRPDWAVKAAKMANKKNILIEGSAFPVLAMKIPSKPELALTHALIRQESEFRSRAGSKVGAQGLMQLMPRTAREMARKLGIRYRRSSLTDPAYNILLGTTFIQRQINAFDGSYVLALAGYNAGPSRVRKWIKMFGDPRDKDVSAIDWIELIPIYETRNYVMRIMENLQFYRARLNRGKAPLLILQDIKR